MSDPTVPVICSLYVWDEGSDRATDVLCEDDAVELPTWADCRANATAAAAELCADYSDTHQDDVLMLVISAPASIAGGYLITFEVTVTPRAESWPVPRREQVVGINP